MKRRAEKWGTSNAPVQSQLGYSREFKTSRRGKKRKPWEIKGKRKTRKYRKGRGRRR